MTVIPQASLIRAANVLWVDDNSKVIEIYKQLLESEDNLDLDIEVISSLESARKKIDTGKYSAVIVDCRMDEFDNSANGAQFLLDVNTHMKDLPTFVYSAYLEDPRYQHLLDGSNALLKVSKLESFQKPLSRDPFFKLLRAKACQHRSVENLHPERIEFSSYLRSPQKYADEVAAHWLKYGDWIASELRHKQCAWCVVCGENIVLSSKSPFDFPGEEQLLQLGIDNNLIPFAYSADLYPEGIPNNSLRKIYGRPR